MKNERWTSGATQMDDSRMINRIKEWIDLIRYLWNYKI